MQLPWHCRQFSDVFHWSRYTGRWPVWYPLRHKTWTVIWEDTAHSDQGEGDFC